VNELCLARSWIPAAKYCCRACHAKLNECLVAYFFDSHCRIFYMPLIQPITQLTVWKHRQAQVDKINGLKNFITIFNIRWKIAKIQSHNIFTQNNMAELCLLSLSISCWGSYVKPLWLRPGPQLECSPLICRFITAVIPDLHRHIHNNLALLWHQKT